MSLFLKHKLIHPSLSPNSSWRDVLIALKFLLLPWNWFSLQKGSYTHQLEKFFTQKQQAPHVICFDSGRSALFTILQALDIGQGDEVLLQAFTCIVVPNAVIWNEATPIYCDIKKETCNLDPADVEKKITKNTKAIIIQHTFGNPADLKQLIKIAKKHKLFIIEDCAHSLGSTYNNKLVGNFGDAAIFSFGRDKVISCIHGGCATTNNPELAKKIRSIQTQSPSSSIKTIVQHLMHPIIFAAVIPLYNLFIGKALLVLSQKLHIVSKVFRDGEKKAVAPKPVISKLPNALACIAISQLHRLDTFETQRKNITHTYIRELSEMKNLKFLHTDSGFNGYRFSIFTAKQKKLKQVGKNTGIYFGDWYDTVIAPKDVQLSDCQYKEGSCPVAESACLEILNLPTHPRMRKKDITRVLGIVKKVCCS